MSLGQCNHAVLCQQIGQEGLFREIRSLHGLLQKQRRRHVSVLRRCHSFVLAMRTVKGIFPMILSSQPHPHTVRLAKHFAALWEIYGLEMTLCVCTEEQEKAFYSGVTQSSHHSLFT